MSAETPITAPSVEAIRDQNPEFTAGLAHLALTLPEVAERQAAIQVRGDELIETFGIKPELFADASRTLLFSAIADRYAWLEDAKNSLTAEDYGVEKDFIQGALVLLALDDTTRIDEFAPQVQTEESHISDEQALSIYDHFTNRQVTEELKAAMQDGDLLTEVRKRMQITPENEEAMDVRVLNVAIDDILYGLRPDAPDIEESFANSAVWENWESDDAAYVQYADDLKQKAADFFKQLNQTGAMSPAWTLKHRDLQILVLPLPLAEKILYKDQPRSKFYGEEELKSEQAYLEHEFVHTQGGYLLGGAPFFGIGAEEVRAEYFSGNRHGYNDAKEFFRDVQLLTGFNISNFFDSHVKGGTKEEFYTALARDAGLHGALEIALMPPTKYVSDVHPLQKQAVEYLGGFDAISKRMYARASKDPAQLEAVNARIAATAEAFAPLNGIEDFIAWRKDMFGLTLTTDLLAEQIEKRQA